ncbi:MULTISPECIES: class I SAM-dependent methyltransferase [unclassified Paraburkholderia]|uniref:class I SAM-dependent methyltransferase n=1 Tax=unclassified Paraburkholderia TaxID=2615204 RepID=UPI00161709C7|nr:MULTISPECIES: class I SAM-dependent methyltransferase [unclassified Paraburkholderia]MBB5445178.1 SAM-dependent methyltransferase [Paraburkholderia sp. WSM4177]MBB5485726.1 SAM-dependent methyltransferase [Paraburkholderia sp. WSM4180]
MDNSVEQQRQHFNEISEKYFSARKDPNHLLLKELIWKNFLSRNKRIAPEIRRVLEPMCGMAEGYDILSKHLIEHMEYHGFDYSEKMVEFAKEVRPTLFIEWDDVTSFKASDNPYDMIILIGGLHHVYSRAPEVIKNLAQSLRSGGYFINFEPTQNNWLTRFVRNRIYKSNDIFDEDTEQGFDYSDLDRYFREAGYTKVDQVYPGLSAYVLYYNPDAFPLLNIGGKAAVRFLFALDRLFWGNLIGRKLSFATMSLWKKS